MPQETSAYNGSPSSEAITKVSADVALEIATWVNKHYQQVKNSRTQIERQWYVNLAFYYGKQNVLLQRVQGIAGAKLITPPAPPWRVRPVINKIRPIIRTELAKVTSQKPTASVVPASSDDADLFAAQAGEQIWESTYYGKDIKRTLTRAIWWTLICGTGYMKTYWDGSKVTPDGQIGDIRYEHETPFHIYVPDFREEEIENQPFVIHASTRTVDYVHLHYQRTLDGRRVVANTRSQNEILDDAFLNLIGTSNMENNSVLVLEMWIKPGMVAKWPQGALITVVGDQLVQLSEGYPYEHKEYPFVKFDHIPTGKYYSDSIIVDLLSPQREYNRTRGQIIEAKNRMAKPQLAAPKGSVDVSRMTSEPGQVIEYKPGFMPPTPIPLQNLPAYVLQEVDRIQQDMDDISGQHEVTRGSVPPGVTAATAISYLQEQDDTKLSQTIDSIESGMEKTARHTLSFVGQYWEIPRMVKITGPDGAWDAVMLKGSDLKTNSDIRMEAGSALPTSKAARQAFVMDMMKLGFIPPDTGLEVMEIGGVQKLYEAIQIDKQQARRENLKMRNGDPQLIMQGLEPEPEVDPNTGQPPIDPETGQPMAPEPTLLVPVNSWDNHAIHIDMHNRFRKSQAFENLPEENRMLFEQHVMAHMAAIAAPHMGGPPTPEMMIGIGQQQSQMPLPSDTNTPMEGQGAPPENPGPEAMPSDMSTETSG